MVAADARTAVTFSLSPGQHGDGPCGRELLRTLSSPEAPVALIASRLHLVWIGTVCVRMRTDFSYSNTLGWNTFPVPTLTDQNKADLARAAEEILLGPVHTSV